MFFSYSALYSSPRFLKIQTFFQRFFRKLFYILFEDAFVENSFFIIFILLVAAIISAASNCGTPIILIIFYLNNYPTVCPCLTLSSALTN